MNAVAPQKYRTSEKRNATKGQNRAAIEAAAWEVFCTIGMDAANIRDIVNRSGVSAGTFYNYFRTKEAIFEVLSQQVLERIRTETRAARATATNLDEFLSLCCHSYLDLLQSIDGALPFIDRNQHHIRSQIYRSSAVSGLAEDLEQELRQFLPTGAMSRQQRLLAASIIIAASAETVFHASRKPGLSVKHMRDFLTKVMTKGLSGWQPARRRSAEPNPAATDRRPKKNS
jgi:AcrR family transcriptional regulator